jgi:hypothetical protein
MHAVLSRRPTSAPLEDLYAFRGLDRLDVGDHLPGHIGVGYAESHILGAFVLGRLVGELDQPFARVVVEWIGGPVHIERDAEGVETPPGSAGDLAAVVTVRISRAYIIAVMEHDCC